jgi:hypothetical protein
MPSHQSGSALSEALTSALRNIANIYGRTLDAHFSAASSLADVDATVQRAGLKLDAVLADAALSLANDRLGVLERKTRNELQFLISDRRPDADLVYTAGSSVKWHLSPELLRRAVFAANRTIEIVHDLSIANNVPIFELLGLRNLSSFVGEIFARELAVLEHGKFLPNPNQDGYPDLCALTPEGQEYVREREKNGEMTKKAFWSPYPYGGVEVKGTCGNTPAASKIAKPKIGESRIPILSSAEWKAHHRESNNLLGLFWDFIDGLPTILAVFFRNDLVPTDWGAIIHPKENGGRTTSVSIMTRDGVKKMGAGWAILPDSAAHLRALYQDRVFGLSDILIAKYCSAFRTGIVTKSSK